MNARRGLQRHGQRCYKITGPRGTYVIERDRAYRWFVKNEAFGDRYGNFFAFVFGRLKQARAFAEQAAGVTNYPYADVPVCCRRWFPSVRA